MKKALRWARCRLECLRLCASFFPFSPPSSSLYAFSRNLPDFRISCVRGGIHQAACIPRQCSLSCFCFLAIIGIGFYDMLMRRSMAVSSRELRVLAHSLPGGICKCISEENYDFLFISDGFWICSAIVQRKSKPTSTTAPLRWFILRTGNALQRSLPGNPILPNRLCWNTALLQRPAKRFGCWTRCV